jgi:hypothetical protein
MSKSKPEFTFQIQINQTRGAVTPESSSNDFVPATKRRLLEVSELIRESCAGVAKDLFTVPNPPAEIGMEFGIDVGGEAGIPFVTKGTISANFKVSVTWKLETEKGKAG